MKSKILYVPFSLDEQSMLSEVAGRLPTPYDSVAVQRGDLFIREDRNTVIQHNSALISYMWNKPGLGILWVRNIPFYDEFEVDSYYSRRSACGLKLTSRYPQSSIYNMTCYINMLEFVCLCKSGVFNVVQDNVNVICGDFHFVKHGESYRIKHV